MQEELSDLSLQSCRNFGFTFDVYVEYIRRRTVTLTSTSTIISSAMQVTVLSNLVVTKRELSTKFEALNDNDHVNRSLVRCYDFFLYYNSVTISGTMQVKSLSNLVVTQTHHSTKFETLHGNDLVNNRSISTTAQNYI